MMAETLTLINDSHDKEGLRRTKKDTEDKEDTEDSQRLSIPPSAGASGCVDYGAIIARVDPCKTKPFPHEDKGWQLKRSLHHLVRYIKGAWIQERGEADYPSSITPEIETAFGPLVRRVAQLHGLNPDEAAMNLPAIWEAATVPLLDPFTIAFCRARKVRAIELMPAVRDEWTLIANVAFYLDAAGHQPFQLPVARVGEVFGFSATSGSTITGELERRGLIRMVGQWRYVGRKSKDWELVRENVDEKWRILEEARDFISAIPLEAKAKGPVPAQQPDHPWETPWEAEGGIFNL